MFKGSIIAPVAALFLAACAHAAGCIGVNPDTCLRNAEAAGFELSEMLPDNTVAAQLAKNSQVDVNGKPLSKIVDLSLSGTIAGLSGLQMLDMTIGPGGAVVAASITLPGDPMIAKTSSEYDSTGIYPAIRILLGEQCAGPSALTVYQFFENKIKPAIVLHRKKTELTDTNASTAHFQAAQNVDFCGAKLDFTNIFGVDTDDISVDNPNGVYQLSTLKAHQ